MSVSLDGAGLLFGGVDSEKKKKEGLCDRGTRDGDQPCRHYDAGIC